MSSGTHGYISSMWFYIFRMNMWLQMYHQFWNPYKGYSCEKLPALSWNMVSDVCNSRILPVWTQSFLCGGLHGVYVVIESIPILYVSNIPYLKRKLLPPLPSEDILKKCWILYRQIKFVFAWSTSSCHHVNHPVSAIVKCKLLIWIVTDSRSSCLWIFSVFDEHSLHAPGSTQPIPTYTRVTNCFSAHERLIFWGFFPSCEATMEINTKITLEWAQKQFVTRIHTLFYSLHNITNP